MPNSIAQFFDLEAIESSQLATAIEEDQESAHESDFGKLIF